MTHPHDTLADYVEGAADERDRALVEAHLATCDECRSDLASARAGLAAARRLPEVEAPSIAATLDLDGAAGSESEGTEPSQGDDVQVGRWRAGPRTARHRVAPGREQKPGSPAGEPRRPGRWGAITAGLAVAAAAAAIFVGALRGGGDDTANVRAGDAEAASPQASLVESNHDYTADELAALATEFVSSSAALSGGAAPTDAATASRNPATLPAATSPVPAPANPSASPGDALQAPRACIDQGSGVTAGLPALHLEAALYEGQEAYIGVFQTRSSSGEPAVLVVAVSRFTCLPLYFGRQTG
jgi:hypothetical protein